MARTHGRIKVEVWEAGSDWRRLSLDAQWTYEMLVSQPQISMCGTVPYTPKKWAKLASDLTIERAEQAIHELEQAWYVIVDRETDELLVRTFVKHDQPWNMPNLIIAARRQFREIDSGTIRSYLADRHEWLLDGTEPEKVKEYEKTRASQRTSERTLPLASEPTSEQESGRSPYARAGTRTTPTPSPEASSVGEGDPADDSALRATPPPSDREPETPKREKGTNLSAPTPERLGLEQYDAAARWLRDAGWQQDDWRYRIEHDFGVTDDAELSGLEAIHDQIVAERERQHA
jgi:hypothetical protein